MNPIAGKNIRQSLFNTFQIKQNATLEYYKSKFYVDKISSRCPK